MTELFVVFAHLLSAFATVLKPGGAKGLVAENLLLRQQLLILRRSRRRAPNLCAKDRLLLGFCSCFVSPRRRVRSAIILKPSSLFRFIHALKQRKYRLLFSSTRKCKPGPKGPAPELIEAILQLKRRNPRCGCPRIAQQIAETFAIEVDKDVVRRVLAAHYQPGRPDDEPSWLTLLSQAKDSLWSVDLFRTESILLKSHWILVIMDVFTRRIIGFGVQATAVDGPALCRMFNQAISGQGLPIRLNLDHDPLFQFRRWQANLRILGIESVRTLPYVPVSNPFVERLIGTIRREYLDRLFYWNAADLVKKLSRFKDYFNQARVHQGLAGITPNQAAGQPPQPPASLHDYHWKSYCDGLFELPIAA
jgi:putative transposase